MEQSVIFRGKNKKKGLRYLLRGLQIFAGIAWVVLAGFCLTMAEAVYYGSRDAFWPLMRNLALFTLPVIAFVIGAQVWIVRLNTTFEYTLADGLFSIEKVLNGNRKKPLMAVDTQAFQQLGRVTSPAYGKALRRIDGKPIICACNGDHPNIFYFTAQFKLKKGKTQTRMVILEPKKAFLEALKACVPPKAMDPDCQWLDGLR